MRPKQSSIDEVPMRAEYDFSNAVRGKYYERYQRGSNIVVLEPDVAVAFPTSEAVNDALRSLLRVAKRSVGVPAQSVKPRAKPAAAR